MVLLVFFFIYGPEHVVMFFKATDVKLLWEAILYSPDHQVPAILIKDSGDQLFINHFDKTKLTYRNN